ncbi:MAG: hypothetical protein CMI08_10480 [Oceanospirillaceae bacterium]|uniref:DUF5610 domain-containing protein n=1 Tax=unclassified Thalassolituus TaxID=2624967 RepID=UPI000C09234E|nr:MULTISPECIES: DUF5610 domain-containing protein [unclassified Thalassolituus]MAK89915.1 hypothetical protein [Thalassolituus sp.]MAS24076.1 hypothetical protein [Oceanospirillaceae bacterium]MAX99608.1 hypothetical protein [Oceanospirillaceae bacterium]MBL35179.1 hypothetical protein [Oceanospirillaceae bacterium]MBS51331.1 hypothetical protein [Oceanospirillaceae bacterium]
MSVNLHPSQFFPSANRQSPSVRPEVNNPGTQQGREANGNDKTKSVASSGPVTLGPRQSAEETAANILNHVQRGLQQLKAGGADAERLQQRLDAAREGIEKGYKDATAMLKDMGMLDDDMKAGIADSRSLVDEGLSKLENSLTASPAQAVAGRESASLSNTLTLQVITRDGDRVNVSFSQSAAAASSWNDRVSATAFAADSEWQMDVQGSLDEGEQKALAGLMKDVQSLSEQFFNGDIGQALKSAGELGFAGDELAAMSLQLTQTSVTASSRYYQPQKPTLPTPELESLKAPLASYVDQYTSALEKLGIFQQPQSMVSELVHQLAGEDERMAAWDEFHQGLNTLLDKSMASVSGQ